MKDMFVNEKCLQLYKFIFIGVISNLILYFAYLVVTQYGIGNKVAMSMLYILGVLQTFFFNRKWTFSHHGDQNSAFLRYLFVYGIGYFINLIALVIFVDRLGYPHQWVQGIMILLVAIFLFVMQKIWVFRIKIS